MQTNSIQLRLLLLTTCTFLLTLPDAFAQKPKQGDWLTEVGINVPGGSQNQYFYNSNVSTYWDNYNYNYQNPIQTVGINSRYYKKVNLVYRTRLSFGGGSSEHNLWNYYGIDGVPFRQSNKTVALSFGFEKHLNNSSNKFSPFHTLGFSAGLSAYRGKHLSDTMPALNGNMNGWSGIGSYTAKANSVHFSMNYMIGFDYWITSDMYVGLEYGLFATYQHTGEREETLIKVNNFHVDAETFKVHKPYNVLNIGNFATPYIRFGWRFYKSPRSGG